MHLPHDDDQFSQPGGVSRAAGVGRERFRLGTMTLDDLTEVGRVERRCFSNPWPVSAYRRELQAPTQNHYLVLRPEGAPRIALVEAGPDGAAAAARDPGKGALRAVPRRTLFPLPLARRLGGGDARSAPPIVGFAGMWVMYDEAHITTIGVDPDHRGLGLGELLLVGMFGEAFRRRAEWLTLEVRMSNDAAQTLYRKYGMNGQGIRRRYYSDNNEDALIMWSRSLRDPAYRDEIGELGRRLVQRLGYAPAGLAPWPTEPALSPAATPLRAAP